MIKLRRSFMNYLNIALQASDEKKYKLSDFKGQKLIVYFYPKDNTSGCTLEAKDFTDLKHEFEELGYKIIGVSKDSIKSHKNFISKQALNLLLLSDPDTQLIQAFDVWKEKQMYGKSYMGVERSTFILDEEGQIVKEYRNIKAKDHAQNVLDDLKG